MSVVKIGNIEGYVNKKINHFNISQFSYTHSEIPFFDLIGSIGVSDILNNTSNDPRSGEISIQISNSTFEKISLKTRFFTTKELKARGIVITVKETLF